MYIPITMVTSTVSEVRCTVWSRVLSFNESCFAVLALGSSSHALVIPAEMFMATDVSTLDVNAPAFQVRTAVTNCQ